MKTILLSFPLFSIVTCLFILINNIPQLPGELCGYLWYAYIPITVLALAFAYGRTAKRKGGGILFAAAVLGPLLYFSVKLILPFASTFTAAPVLLATVPCAILGEILGKTKNQPASTSASKHKKPRFR